MLDPNLLRNELEAAATALADRGYTLDTERYQSLEARRKETQARVEALQAERNKSARSIGQAKARGEDIQPLLYAVGRLGEELDALDGEFRAIREEQQAWLLEMPNLAAEGVPVGNDETETAEVRLWGEPP